MDHSGGFYDADVKVVTAHAYKTGLYLLSDSVQVSNQLRKGIKWIGLEAFTILAHH